MFGRRQQLGNVAVVHENIDKRTIHQHWLRGRDEACQELGEPCRTHLAGTHREVAKFL